MKPQQQIETTLSFASRLGHLALLLSAVIMTSIVTALLVTETALPMRTQLSFAAIAVVGVCWAGYAGWALTHKRPLLAGHRVVAARIAIVASLAFSVGAGAVFVTSQASAALLAGLLGLTMLAVAIWMEIKGRQRVSALRARRAALEAELA